MKSYFEQKLKYTDDGRLVGEDGRAIMMDWETQIMEFQAKHICQKGGDILNVGFGMGIMDDYIETYNIKSHTIIEPHPDVIEKIMKDDWLKKPHVKVIFKTWQEVMYYLPKYDGIYIDTWDEMFTEFIEYSPKILKPEGILSFFNNPMDDKTGNHLPDPYFDFISKQFNVEFKEMVIPFVAPASQQSGTDKIYWSPKNKNYFSPILSLKK
jgi:protein arginine N-methyltransferase 2